MKEIIKDDFYDFSNCQRQNDLLHFADILLNNNAAFLALKLNNINNTLAALTCSTSSLIFVGELENNDIVM